MGFWDTYNRAKGEAGFTLLETLVALAIMAVASLALFQSTTAMLSLSDRAVAASERSLDSVLDRKALNGVLDGLVPAWPDQGRVKFTGNGTRLSGLTSGGLSVKQSGAQAFALTLETRGNRTALIYTAINTSRSARRIDDAPQPITLMANLPDDVRFAYKDDLGTWSDIWPPEMPAPSGVSRVVRSSEDMRSLMPPPPLPVAIALRRDGGGNAAGTLMITAVRQAYDLPPDNDIMRQTIPSDGF